MLAARPAMKRGRLERMTLADQDDCRNEITELASSCKHTRDQLKDAPDPAVAEAKRSHWQSGALAIGIGVGSAALAAALIYANRNKRAD